MKKRVLAIAMTLAMTLSLLPVSALATEGEPPEEETQQSISTNELSEPAEDVEITVGDVTINEETTVVVGSSADGMTISQAITNGAKEITLGGNVTEDVTIPKNAKVTIDLAGYTLTNSSGHTITNYGTLTIEDSGSNGIVDNVTHAKAAIYNYPGGTVTLNGGTYDRSHENGQSATQNGGNSSYTLKNFGTMIVNAGVTVQQDGTSNGGTTGRYSSLFANGWQDGRNADKENGSEPQRVGTGAKLIINGGTFIGGLNTIKNDDYGFLTINGGTFQNFAQSCFLNWNVAEISDGIFNGSNASSAVILNGYINDTMDRGILDISGGKFTGNTIIGKMQGVDRDVQDVSITGGTFSSNVSAYVPENYECVENEGEDTYTVKEMEAKLVVKQGTDESGNISATLEGNYSSSGTQIDKPAEGAGSATDDTATKHVEIDLTTTDQTEPADAESTTLKITQATASSLSEASSLTVTTNEGTVELDGTALKKVGEAKGAVSITVTKNSVASETSVAASYTVEVKSGSTELLPDGESGNGTITLTLPVPAASQGTTLYVWYAVEQTGGSVMYVDRVATYRSGTDVTFNVGHLSRYDLLSSEPDETAVASITNSAGTQYYESLGDAIGEVGEDETITLIENIPDAEGIAVPSEKKFTVDFNGFTYTLAGPGAGSTNTETNGFQLLKDSTITFKNGTIQIAKNAINIKRIIQNYADLTLENMQIYAQNQVGGEDYALSFNNGNITFKGSTSVYTTSDDTIAFDVCKYASYPSTNVTFDNSYTGTINGQIVYDSSDAKTHSLTINGNGQFGGISKTSGSAVIPNITVKGGTFANSVAGIAKTPTYEVDKNTGSYPYSYTDKYAEAIENAGPGGVVSIADKTGSTSVYKVTFVYGDNRNNTTSEVESGTTVTLPDAYRIGYTFNGWRSNVDNDLHKKGTSVTITANTTFTADWTRNQTDRPSSSSDSGDYLITVDRVSGGRVTVQPGRADKGDTVTITVYPNDGYELDELVVTDSRGNEIDLDARSATRFTFTMPSGKVTVEASFVREGGQTQTPQTTFADVPASAWYYDAVEYVYENGLMSGVSGGRFAPDDTLTRAMLVQTLYAMEGRPAAASAGFADVASGDWYASAVNWAAANGVVSGVSETGFGPNNALTREQLALILYRFAQYKGYDVTGTSDLAAYADGSSVSGWAAEAMGWAVDAGLISGVGGNQIAPTGTASRAQVAQILMNFCENVAR